MLRQEESHEDCAGPDGEEYLPKATVVIPVKDRPGLLDRTLGSLAAQIDAGPFDVVVVDDGSTENIGRLSQKYQTGASTLTLTCIRREQVPSSPGAARDVGARSSEADVLIFLDAGVMVPVGFVAAHRAAHRTGRRIGVGHYHGHLLHQEQDDTWADLPEGAAPDEALLARHRSPAVRDLRSALPPLSLLAQPWVYCWGGNLSCRRDDYLAIGGFSHSHGFGFEDLDLAWRLHRSGVVPGIVEDGWGIHLPHPRAPLEQRHALDVEGWEVSYRRDKALDLEVARLAIDRVGFGPDALTRLDATITELRALLAVAGPGVPAALPEPPRRLPGPTCVIAGSSKDLDTYDFVALGSTNLEAAERGWGCGGVLLPVPDRTLGTVLIRSGWLARLRASPHGSYLLERLGAEVSRTSEAVAVRVDTAAEEDVSRDFVSQCQSVTRLVWTTHEYERMEVST